MEGRQQVDKGGRLRGAQGAMVHPRHDALLAHPGGQLVSNSVCSQSFSARAANFGQTARDSTSRSGSRLNSTRLDSTRAGQQQQL